MAGKWQSGHTGRENSRDLSGYCGASNVRARQRNDKNTWGDVELIRLRHSGNEMRIYAWKTALRRSSAVTNAGECTIEVVKHKAV
jgi:hypothetical protein